MLQIVGSTPSPSAVSSAPVDVVKSTLSEEEGRETLDKPEKLVQGQSSWLYQWLSAPMIVNFNNQIVAKMTLSWCLVVDQLFKPIVSFNFTTFRNNQLVLFELSISWQFVLISTFSLCVPTIPLINLILFDIFNLLRW